MHQRYFCIGEPPPRPVRMLEAIKRHRKAVVASPVAMGGAAALISYMARMKKLNDEIECNNSINAELRVREEAESKSTARPGFASTRMDSFAEWASYKAMQRARWELHKSDAFISILESDFASCAYVRDGGIAAAISSAVLLAAYAALRAFRNKWKKDQALAQASQPHRERRMVHSMDDLAHARTELRPPEKPPYYGHYHPKLSRKLERQLHGHAAAVAEIALMVFPRVTINMIMDDPSDLGPFIGAQRLYYEAFQLELLKRGLRPGDIFFSMDLPPKKPN